MSRGCFHPGRYVVDLLRFARFPVFWGYCGQGEPVRRGVWMHESKQGYLIPYPPRYPPASVPYQPYSGLAALPLIVRAYTLGWCG